MNITAVKSKFYLLYGKIKASKWTTICLLVLLGMAGRYGYDHWKDKEIEKEARIKTYIILHRCAVVLTGTAHALGLSDTADSCTKDAVDSTKVYDNLKDDDHRLQFLVDTCRSGTHSIVSEVDCKDQAWKAIYGNN